MKTMLIAVSLLWSSCCLAARGQTPGYPCFHPATAPVVDGEVANDPAWQALPSVTGFRRLGDGYTDAKQTTAQACWDDGAIYIAMTCEEPDSRELKPAIRDGGPTWIEDSVEIFLQPASNGRTFQFGVTAGGAMGSGENSPDITKCRAAAKIGSGFYSLELRIPFEVLSAQPKAGDQWLATFCRNIWTTTSGGDKFTNWAPLETRFLEPEHFLPLTFEARTPPPAEAAKLTEELNQEYRTTLVRGLRTAAKQAAEHLPALEEAAKDEHFAARANELLHQWQSIQRVDRDPQSASLASIRQATGNLTRLVAASYQVKYEYLIQKLIADE